MWLLFVHLLANFHYFFIQHLVTLATIEDICVTKKGIFDVQVHCLFIE